MTKSYRQHFNSKEEASRYQQEEYSSPSYARLLWELEQATLDPLVRQFRQTHPNISYLDFASGTGRLAAYMEDRVDLATSIEISESMANVARQRLRRTQVLCKDITSTETSVEGQYDFITAFRFFLNAEPALRTAAMRELAARLKDETSWLVFNNHGNFWSTKILMWPVHTLRNAGKGWQPRGNYLRHAEIIRLLNDAGLRIVSMIGLGVLGGTVSRRLSYDTALRLERRCAAGSLANRFAQDIVYVVCRDLRVGSPRVTLP
jgi:SAM-dependent methyltransferase